MTTSSKAQTINSQGTVHNLIQNNMAGSMK